MRLFLFLLFVSCSSFAQQKFFEGYFVNRMGEKVSCFVAQADYSLASQPEAVLQFKRSASSSVETVRFAEVNEFGIGTSTKFIRAEVLLEDSSLYDASLPVSGDPVWTRSKILLRVLVEGKASLYSYQSGNGEKFFFSIGENNLPVTQLLYMRWRPSELVFKEKKEFQQQLYKNLGCLKRNVTDYLKLAYDERDLKKLFTDVNAKCNGAIPYTVYKNDIDSRFHIRLTAEAGVRIIALSASNFSGRYIEDSFLAVNPGLEGELVPSSGKWSAFVGLDFSKVNAETNRTVTQSANPDVYYERVSKVNLTAFNIPFGIRYYPIKTDVNCLSLEVSVAYCGVSGEVMRREFQYISGTLSNTSDNRYTLNAAPGVNFGIGYTFKQKWGARFVMGTQRNYLTSYDSPDIKALSNEMRFVLRYTFF